MKKKVVSLMLALAMLLALAACGGGKDPAPEGNPSAGAPVEASAGLPNVDLPDTDSAGDKVPVSYKFEDGTLTCSGNGEIVQEDWISVISNALFETDEDICKEAVKKLVLEPGVEVIGDEVFKGCKNLTGVLDIPEGVLLIGKQAFMDTGLASITLPNSVMDYGNGEDGGIFQNCKNLFKVSLPEYMNAIPKSMFLGCKGLTKLELPENLTAIGSKAFSGTGITELTLPASLQEWDSHTLANMQNLTDLTVLCETTMENVADLLSKVLWDSHGNPRHITIHAASGSTTEGYIKREMEKNPDMTECVTLETF